MTSDPNSNTPNGAALFLPEAANQILSLNNPQTFEEGDTMVGMRGYCWLRYASTESSRALAHVNIRMVTFENISQLVTNPVMGRADEGNEGPSSENLLWAGACFLCHDSNLGVTSFDTTKIESKAKRKLVSETGIYLSATQIRSV